MSYCGWTHAWEDVKSSNPIINSFNAALFHRIRTRHRQASIGSRCSSIACANQHRLLMVWAGAYGQNNAGAQFDNLGWK